MILDAPFQISVCIFLGERCAREKVLVRGIMDVMFEAYNPIKIGHPRTSIGANPRSLGLDALSVWFQLPTGAVCLIGLDGPLAWSIFQRGLVHFYLLLGLTNLSLEYIFIPAYPPANNKTP